MRETEKASTIKKLPPLGVTPIKSSVEDPYGGTLPILHAQKLLQPFLPGGRRRTTQAVGGMVKRHMNRY